MYNKTIYELSRKGKLGFSLPKSEIDNFALKEEHKRQTELKLPEVSEFDVVRHYTNLSNKNYGVETGMYPLGSCTMKYNPKINEELVSKFSNLHPLQDPESCQGLLKIIFETESMLSNITGFPHFTFSPCAGAHGELTGMMIMKEYFLRKGETNRTKVIIPDSAHGTNPATCTMCGFEVITVPSLSDGTVDIEELADLVDENVAGIMLTNPNTIGIFEKNILSISKIMHNNGSLLYYDGANLNAILGKVRPRDMGFDIMHINIHKTFSTPHGGGGPGSGPVGVTKELYELLPSPVIVREKGKFSLKETNGIGKVSTFYGNILVVIRAYLYLLSLGKENISQVSNLAVLNANYVKARLKDYYNVAVRSIPKHEVVFDGVKVPGIRTIDIAKRMMDYGYHPPTIYFPLLFKESMMIEPVENESLDTLDEFCDVMIAIAKEAKRNPEILKAAPHKTNIRRLDEVKAAKDSVLIYEV